ncbi:uncharacterized protein METZ01_LOCUS431550, partial [marine metagenome]
LRPRRSHLHRHAAPLPHPETIYAPTLRHLASGLEGQRAL